MIHRFGVAMIALVVAAVLAGPCWSADAVKIGTVNFTLLVKGYNRMKVEQDAGIKIREQLRQEDAARRDEINGLAGKLQQHTPDSDAYKKTDAELRQKKAALDTWWRLKQEELIDEDARIMRGIYLDVEAAAMDYGKKNAYTLILKEDDLDISKAGVNELQFRVALRKVLYADPSTDITDALVKTLNEKYKARTK